MPFTAPTTVASKANTGYLATLSLGVYTSGVAGSYNPVSELKSFKANLNTVPEVNVSTLLSPGNTEEFFPGMIKPGTIDMSGNLIGDASQLAITTAAQAQTIFPFKIIASIQGTKTYTLTGAGYWAEYSPGPWENNKPVEFTAKIQMTGSYTEVVA